MALKSTTPTLEIPPPGQDQASTLPERFKAYADAPSGAVTNKYLVYQTHDIDHSTNLLLRLIAAGWKVRSAWHQFADGRSIRIDHHARQAGLINANK